MYTKIANGSIPERSGTMIVEMRTYTLVPGSVPKFLKAYEERGLAVHTKILGRLLGYFTTEIGDINQLVHLWGYDDFDDRKRRRALLQQNDEWQSFLTSALPYLLKQEIRLLTGTSFSPIR